MVVVVALVGGLAGWLVSDHTGRSPSLPPGSTPSTATPPTSTTTTTVPPYQPPSVATSISPTLAGEGQWTPADTWDPGPPSIYTTSFRPDPTQPSIIAYAAWVRTSSTQLALYPGYEGPGPSTLDRGPEMVPAASRATLLACFNSGFYEKDSAAGFYAHGQLYFPMVNGLATVVSYSDGHVDLIDWTGGPTPGPDVVMARQNLPLLVSGGAPTPAAADPGTWGLTLGGVPAVWRTGLGIDRRGNLIYVAAPAQTAASLARILVDLGAVQGMQLDINPAWPIFTTYGGPGAAAPALFVPNPNQVTDRFLYSSTKDFFAVFVRVPGVSEQPW